MPLCITFINHEKTFGSIEINVVLDSLELEGVKEEYIKLLKEANSNCTTNIALLSPLIIVPVNKDVNREA